MNLRKKLCRVAALMTVAMGLSISASAAGLSTETELTNAEQSGLAALQARVAVANKMWAQYQPLLRAGNVDLDGTTSRMITFYNMTNEQLAVIGQKSIRSLADLDAAFASRSGGAESTRNGTNASKALGENNKDWVFRAFSPCRLLDTRFPTAGQSGTFNTGAKIANGAIASVSLNGNNRGSAPGCNVYTLSGIPTTTPIAIGAVALNVVALNSTSNGYFALRPFGIPSTAAWATIPVAGQDAGSGGILSLDQSTASSEFQIYPVATDAHFAIDAFGAFVRASQSPAALDCTVTVATVSVLAGAVGTDVTTTACSAGYSLVSGSCSYPTANGGVRFDEPSAGGAGSAWYCSAFNNAASGATTLTARSRCCRTPGF